jgi:hypothetical protein
MKRRYIFTVVAGRSGQAYLSDVFKRYVPNCYPAFEEPQINRIFKGRMGAAEQRLRRKYFETHELLGRGKVLTAFEENDFAYIEKIAMKRIQSIDRILMQTSSSLYVDVSKFFARGLHQGFIAILPKLSLIRLLRDPVANMRSFLNRDKNFFLDNNSPESFSNMLRLDSNNMEKGELYLWIWCELYLRFNQMVKSSKVVKHIDIRTERLDDTSYLDKVLDSLEVDHRPIEKGVHLNTNACKGFGETKVTEEDIETFDRFLNRLPKDIRTQLSYFDDYDPKQLL